jgi:hypothetical protein
MNSQRLHSGSFSFNIIQSLRPVPIKKIAVSIFFFLFSHHPLTRIICRSSVILIFSLSSYNYNCTWVGLWLLLIGTQRLLIAFSSYHKPGKSYHVHICWAFAVGEALQHSHCWHFQFHHRIEERVGIVCNYYFLSLQFPSKSLFLKQMEGYLFICKVEICFPIGCQLHLINYILFDPFPILKTLLDQHLQKHGLFPPPWIIYFLHSLRPRLYPLLKPCHEVELALENVRNK